MKKVVKFAMITGVLVAFTACNQKQEVKAEVTEVDNTEVVEEIKNQKVLLRKF